MTGRSEGSVLITRRFLVTRPVRTAAGAGIGLALMLMLLLAGLWVGVQDRVATYDDHLGADLGPAEPPLQRPDVVAHALQDCLVAVWKESEKVLPSFPTCPIPEIRRLGRTLRQWKRRSWTPTVPPTATPRRSTGSTAASPAAPATATTTDYAYSSSEEDSTRPTRSMQSHKWAMTHHALGCRTTERDLADTLGSHRARPGSGWSRLISRDPTNRENRAELPPSRSPGARTSPPERII
jgi:hypothetical protein